MRNQKQFPRRKNQAKVIALDASKKQAAFKLVNVAVIISLFVFFIALSSNNGYLFFREMLLAGGVVIMLCLLNIGSNR